MAIARLLAIVRRSDHPVEAAEIEDNSQAHALHILKSLVHDGGLNAEIGLYLADILQASIESFNSPSWAIRNAALQLFGKSCCCKVEDNVVDLYIITFSDDLIFRYCNFNSWDSYLLLLWPAALLDH